MNSFGLLDAFTLIGALGMFLFGMNMMSESLQKVAGNKMRLILSSMTKNRFVGVLSGIIITSIIQSSSATTVLIVSFVNAGLLTLGESISVIMGANIGTTVTAWIVSLIGFKFSIAEIAIPLIGLAMPFVFSKKDKRKTIGQLIIGFSLLFLGLEYLKNGVPDIKSHPEILTFLQDYTNMGFLSILLFLLVGTLLTIIVQSSSATMAITLVMISQGWISFEIGAAMVLGENIGTTITANIAAITANINSKRAALSHTLFNVFGVIWVLILFYPFTKMVGYIVNFDPETHNNALYALSMFHTLFNLCNTIIMIFLIKTIEKIVCKIIPDKNTDNEFALKFISSGLLQTGELSLIEAEKEIELYTERTHRMLYEAKEYALSSIKDKNNHAERIKHYEEASDNTESAISDYLYNIAATPTSTQLKSTIRSYLYLTSEIESVADRCYNISRLITRKNNDNVVFSDYQISKISEVFDLVDQHFTILEECVKNKFTDKTKKEIIFELENKINKIRYDIKLENIEKVNMGEHSYISGIYFMDVIEECESLSDAITKIAKDIKINN